MKRYFLLFFLYSSVYSQELPKLTPPSPTAYQLGKYGEIPIGLFTGSPNVSVPLLEYKTKDLTIPIILGYSSNGIKVDELETKVGLGWVINTGGIITRTTKQGPDELRTYQYPPVVNQDFKTYAFTTYYKDLALQFDGISQSLTIDGEPDTFNFNFLGRTGSFTFNNDKKIVLLSDFSLQVTYNPDGLGGFLITDEKGIKYYFNTNEISRIDSIGGSSQYNSLGRDSTTSWSITRIELPNKDIINFTYSNEVYSYVTSQNQYLTLFQNYPISNTGGNAYCTITAIPPTESPLIDQILSLQGKKLATISSNNPMYGVINFEYNILHPQVANYSMLSSITLKNNLNNIVEKVALNYTTTKQRMFLNEVSFLDTNKKYNFDYGDLSDLPNRLSLSKDQWGYYNGKNNLKLYPNLSGANTTQNYFHVLFPNGANRNLDETKAKIGLLKKLIYPTRGYSEFEYESNDYYTSENTSTMSAANLQISTTLQDPLFAEKASTLTLPNLAENYIGPLKISFSVNYQSCASSPASSADRKLFIQIINLTNPLDNNMISLFGEPLGLSTNSIIITENDVNMNKYLVRLTKNNSYSIKISVFYQCLMGKVEFDYPNNPAQVVFFNKKTGGLRVSKVTNKESSGTFLSSKKYFYANKDNLNVSSGTLPLSPNYLSNFTIAGACFPNNNPAGLCLPWKMNYVKLNSNDLKYSYIPEFQNTRYEYVTESEDNDQFINGGTENKFKIEKLQWSSGAIVFGGFQEVFPKDANSWGNGLNLEKTIFKKEGGAFKLVHKEIYDYQRDSRINEIIYGFKVSRKFILPCRSLYSSDPAQQELAISEDELDVTKYEITTNWNYLNSKTVQLFDNNGLNPIETVTNYFYDNPVHCQLTRTITNNSKGIPTITKTYYPDDVLTANSLGLETLSADTFTSFNKLKTPTASNPNALHQNGLVIQNETYSDANKDGVANSNELLSSQRINYKDWGNNNVLPEKVQTLTGEYNASTNALQDRIQFYSYYDDSKIKELSQKDGSHIVYIWGYNKTQLIAKIENATYNEISSYISNLQSLSNTGTEQNLIAALNTLRTSLPNAMVTTYTYIPLVGVSTVTDPKGDKITYLYNSFGRLEFVKDNNGNILSENQYNYKQ